MPKQNLSNLFSELESIVASLNITLKLEKIKTIHPRKGGLCLVKGKYFLYIEKKTSLSEKVSILIENIALFEIDDIYISPNVRKLINNKKIQLKENGKFLPVKANKSS